MYPWNWFAVIHILDVMQIWYPKNEFSYGILCLVCHKCLTCLYIWNFVALFGRNNDSLLKLIGHFLKKETRYLTWNSRNAVTYRLKGSVLWIGGQSFQCSTKSKKKWRKICGPSDSGPGNLFPCPLNRSRQSRPNPLLVTNEFEGKGARKRQPQNPPK